MIFLASVIIEEDHRYFIVMKKCLVGMILICCVTHCSHEPTIPTDPIISFAKDVSPIILNNCATADCHASTGNQHERPLETYGEVMHYVDMVGKDAYKSRLMVAITSLNGEKAMPPNRPLPEAQLKIIYIWILQGAKDN